MEFKKTAPANVVESLQALETLSDACYENLRLYSASKGLASWAVLVSLVLRTERSRELQGYKDYNAVLINLSVMGTLVLRWIQEKARKGISDPHYYEWNASLAGAIDEGLEIAHNYSTFLNTFPMWHQDRLMGEILGNSRVRFMVPGGVPAKQVSAFHKSFRPRSDITPKGPHADGLVPDSEQARERDKVLTQCFHVGHLKMSYPVPFDLYRLLFPPYLERSDTLFRRDGDVDLGPYTIDDLKLAYAALTTVCSVHEDLCFRFGQRHGYPVNSCVMMRTAEEWSRLISTVSGLALTKCSAVVDDLTLGDRYWDLHVHPLVPVDGGLLAVAPQFPLHARGDETLLRICGHRRPACFSIAAAHKETEMLTDLIACCPENYSPKSQISLPTFQGKQLPDIDLLLVDESSFTVLVAECKWNRKPMGWKERLDRDADFGKGLDQLIEIRNFLNQHPDYLRERQKLEHSLTHYKNVSFALVARDHFFWPDTPDILLVDHEVFKTEIADAASLAEVVSNLRTYEWLPVEGIDFLVRFEPSIANGVTVESETFYRIPS